MIKNKNNKDVNDKRNFVNTSALSKEETSASQSTRCLNNNTNI